MRKTVEETPNALLDEEASELIGAERHKRTAGREAYPQRSLRQKARHWSRGGRDKFSGNARCARGGVPRGPPPALRGDSYRNALGRVPVTRRKAAARMLKAIHAQKSREACARKAEEVAEKLESMRLGTSARTARDGFAETLACTEFPSEHWCRIRTNNGIERINREIRR